MLDLISNYSITEIFTFLIVFGLAVKGVVSFYDWAHDRLKKTFKKEDAQEEEIETLQSRINQNVQRFKELSDSQADMNNKINMLVDKVNLLLDSDKDDIKSFITKEHHYFVYQAKWIDDHSLDCIERRYSHYKAEGGNSFIKDLMEEIRRLPKQPPEE